MKKKVIIIISVVALIALAIAGAYAVDMHRMNNFKPVVFSSWGYDYAPPEENPDDVKTINEYDEAYNPDEEQSFVGTVLEETTEYMIVEPAEDEYERTVAENIKIDYGTDHRDYLYGIGRKVVIYYKSGINSTENPVIKTDDISTDGFREWEMKVTPTEIKGHKTLAVPKRDESDNKTNWFREYNLYYYNIGDVIVTVDGNEYPLAHALKLGKISMSAILAKANQDVSDGIIQDLRYKDGGSVVFKYPDYTIVKYHTLDGNDDMYIGTPDIGIDVKDK